MKLSVAIITGPSSETIVRTLDSVRDIADEICIVQTVEDEATETAIKEFFGSWDGETRYEIQPELMHEDGTLRSFAEARNESFKICTGDWIFWIDTDDSVAHPYNLRKFIDQVHENGYHGKKVDMISMDYDYEFDQNGLCTTRHSRERIVRNGYFEWNSKAPIHEVLSPVRPAGYVKLDRSESYIIHHNVIGESDGSRELRNVKILKRVVDSGEADARMKMYYANSLGAVGEHQAAAYYYQEYLEESSWDEERYQVMLRLCDLYKKEKEFELAGTWAAEAARLLPSLRDGYLALAEVSALQEDWDKVLEWLKVFDDKKESDTSMLHNPAALETKPWILAQQAYLRIGEFALSAKATEKLIEFFPDKKDQLNAHISYCRKQIHDLKLISAYETVIKSTPDEDRSKVFDLIPEELARDYEPFGRNKPKIRPDGKRVCAIYCGYDTTRSWGPESIYEGIGGSEEAVINISKELAILGWHVEVYANVSNEFTDPDTGVVWYSAMRSNPTDHVDLTVLWRHPQHKHRAPAGRVTWLWNHDLQDGMEPFYDEDTMQGIDSVMFLSKFHRETAPWVSDEKVFYTRNGVDPSLMRSGQNDPFTVIYASSPDRGLDNLLSIWPKVKEAHPEARLKVFYGFNKWFDSRYANDEKMISWKSSVIKQMEDDPTIDYRGSVGQDVLADEIASSGVWAYPTQFGEISCITAMKMQCGGAIPVCTRYAALEETVNFGEKVGEYLEPVFDKDEYTEKLIQMVGNEQAQRSIRGQMQTSSRLSHTWSSVAKDWDQRYLADSNKKFEERAGV